jgi:hypothetical protein
MQEAEISRWTHVETIKSGPHSTDFGRHNITERNQEGGREQCEWMTSVGSQPRKLHAG